MLTTTETSSAVELRLTDTVTHSEPVNVPATSSVVSSNHQVSAVQQLPAQHAAMDCHGQEERNSVVTAHSQLLATSASHGKVCHGRRTSSNRRSAKLNRGQRKITSGANRTGSVVMTTDNHHSNLAGAGITGSAFRVTVATDDRHSNVSRTSSAVDTKALLRAVLLSGSRRNMQKPGKYVLYYTS